MKKIMALIMAIFIMFGFTGCGGPSAEESLTSYLDVMCCKDEDKVLEKYINGEEVDEDYKEFLGDDFQYFKSSGLDEFMLALYKNLDYEVVSVEENGDTATGKVTFYMVDFGNSYEQAVKDTISWFKNNLSASTSDITNKIMDNFTNEINDAAQKDTSVEKTVTFIMSKEDGVWNIDNMNSAMDELFSDAMSDMNDVNNNINDYF
ncbi:DUF5105 domain-containing protein [Anaerofustis sp. NSJ-163]|uniref:DUF5105 domain-containing protein n=1 Tax=Anaerofustis sp. NSJ-163 TaxID=2944391 RepID=UPI00209C274D|nr:DUF5105 domain-containing protein [Anaerofustis sp. NSJ-163]MCO8193193.1 DUF5105 domain-containing protein [Anaerofustis sp. NSJ-163]